MLGWASPLQPPGLPVRNYEILPRHGLMFLLVASFGFMLFSWYATEYAECARLGKDSNLLAEHGSEGAGFSLAWSGGTEPPKPVRWI
jgi:hypothetical protein